MTNRLITIPSILLLSCTGAPATAQVPALVHDCPPATACVEMTLSTPSPETVILERGEMYGRGFADFTLRVRAQREGDESASTVDLRWDSFVDGLTCSELGSGTVAVLGFDGSDPILLTSDGRITVNAVSLRVGCPECGRLRSPSGENLGPTATSPAWDFSSVAVDRASFSYDDGGSLYFSQNGQCVGVHLGGPVTLEPRSRCGEPREIPRPSWAEGVPTTYKFYQAPSGTAVLRLDSGACT